MTIEREVITETTTTPVERTSYVRGASPFGVIGGIVVAALLLLLVLWFFGAFNGGSGTVDVDLPSVTVTPDGQ